MHKTNRNNPWESLPRLAFGLAGVLALLGVMFAFSRPGIARAEPGDLSNAVAKYPNISGTVLQQCALCHDGAPPALNFYGADYLANGRSPAAFGLIENLDSDHDGFSNLQEITTYLTFPGNPDSAPPGGPTATNTPTNTTAPPTATRTNTPTATRTNTPTSTFTNTPVAPTATRTNTPTATPTNTSPAPTSTNTFTPTPTFTNTPVGPTATFTNTAVPPTATRTNAPTSTPTNTTVAPTPTYTNTPTATSTGGAPTATNTPTNTPLPPTPTFTPTPTTPPAGGLDLDIKEFRVTSEIELGKGRSIRIRLDVINASQINGQGMATVIGRQRGREIYRASMPVGDPPGGGFTRFTFPSYTPTKSGLIIWVVSLTDDNPDRDIRYRFTEVKFEHEDDEGGDNHSVNITHGNDGQQMTWR